MENIVIWDWNGTLLDDVEINHSILNSMLHKRGLQQIDLETYKTLFRMPIIELYKDLGFTFIDETFPQAASEYFELYKAAFPNMPLSSGVLDVLSFINSKNIKQYIISAMNESDLIIQVKDKGISHFFENIIGLDNVHAISKIDRAVEFIKTINTGQQKLFIGDMDHDYEVAQSIGARCILYSKGHQYIKENPNYSIINDLCSIKQYI